MSYSLNELAEFLDARVEGDGGVVVETAASITDAGVGDICYVGNRKYIADLRESSASAFIITEDLIADSPAAAIVVENPRAAYAKVLGLLYPEFQPAAGIEPSAVIAASAKISKSAYIGANVVIEENAIIADDVRIDAGCVVGRDSRIGKSTHLCSNVTIYHGCVIGEYCILHSSTVIGADGFGFEFDQGEWLKIPQVGGVLIGNNVEIGACSAVDRGALNDTLIGDGVKLDNHVQIAHGVQVGQQTIMSRGVGIAGSTRIGKNCIFAGMTGVKDNIEVTDNVTVTAMSMVSKSLSEPGSYSSNTPIDDTRSWRKNSARFRQLDEMARKIRQLEKLIKEKD